MLYVGNLLVVVGIMMLSLCNKYYQVFLAQGVCMGLGAGLLYIPSLALVGVWFSKKRALAMGVVTSGIAVGGVIYIITFNRLTVSSGFPWAIRTIGFITLVTSVIAMPALLSGSNQIPALQRKGKARKLLDMSAWKDPLFLIFTLSTFTTFFGYLIPYFYIPTFAQQRLGVTEEFALYILVTAIAGTFFGRLVVGYVAHYIGSIVAWACCAAISGVLALCWIAIKTQASLIAFSVLWGTFHTVSLEHAR